MADLTYQSLLQPDSEELQGLNRNRALSQMLLQNAQQSPQGQMVDGHYVKSSPLQFANQLFNAYAGNKGLENADVQQQQLATTLRQQKGEAFSKFQELMSNPDTRGEAMQFAAKNQYLQPMAEALMKPQNLAEGARLVMPNISGGAPIDLAVGGEKKTEAIRGYEMAKSQGYPGSFFDYEQQLKRAGASNVSVSMDKGIAAQVGPMMKEGQLQATSAVKGIDASNQVINALDTNKLFTGPLANQKLSIAQLSTTFGGASGDLTQKINNTRAAIQGLAEITLQGRQEMHGQGAITESEGKLAERAKSGDISLTPGELKQLANAAKRAGEFTYNNYQNKLQIMAKDPATAQMAPYFAVNQMPARQAPQQVQQVQPNANQQLNIPSANGWSVIGVK